MGGVREKGPDDATPPAYATSCLITNSHHQTDQISTRCPFHNRILSVEAVSQINQPVNLDASFANMLQLIRILHFVDN